MSAYEPESRVREFLLHHGLMQPAEAAVLTPLAGGVSSDLWRVDLPGRSLCVKGALARLKVAQEWLAPTSRNRVEYDWLQLAGTITPGQVPQVLAYDEQAGLFAMQFLPPEDYPVWKTELLAGHIEPTAAYAVGDLVGRLHAASAKDPSAAAKFATDDNFDALRIEPYFRVTARANPDVDDRIDWLAAVTTGTHLVVVHGDVSPKNILLGPHGPVLLDAECAWFGDPAFDVAFCLNHLLLKAMVLPDHIEQLHRSAQLLLEGYMQHINWEPAAHLMGRVAALLPLLALARVDGASPLEYLSPDQRHHVRDLARSRMARPIPAIDVVIDDWMVAARATTAGAPPIKEPAP
ncbi:phosphotransferase family protein [Paenarthrobacter aromaticivorans]|uniref:Aminoglycoside phosphotransferase family protein n=1 Tax=Paenarthrobacter aromaticivorans TaxID=2849150 RepID=A0ABS6I653_9MICC|nr:aminoglycoside phosphotransferase family protein [Paenarthrobacter sp. MMS21-TAE1-1]MBU8865909.1 aminoglycoside phosphotransferase family protein [Paenarthrobacter sp. MMS21-TAE1-1]